MNGGAHMLIGLSSWYKTSLPPKIELIRGAMEQRRAIRFTYFSPKGESARTVEPDGRPRFSGGFPDADSVLSWVLTFGDKAELREPEELREQLRALAGTPARRYRRD